MNKILFALIASVTALSSVSIAHAEGAYAGVGVGAARYKFDVPNAVSSDDHSSTEPAGKVFGGYEFDKMFGVEAGYTNFGSKSYSFTQGGVPGSIDTDSHSFYVAGKAAMPVNEQVSVFGKLGASRNHNGISGTGAAAGVQDRLVRVGRRAIRDQQERGLDRRGGALRQGRRLRPQVDRARGRRPL